MQGRLKKANAFWKSFERPCPIEAEPNQAVQAPLGSTPDRRSAHAHSIRMIQKES